MVDQLAPQLSDREQYWDHKVAQTGGDPVRAVCRDTAEENSCIDRVQRALARSAMNRIRRTRGQTGAGVLDYGCGTGRWVDFLRGYGCEYTGVDLSSAMLAVARRGHPDAEFRKGDGLVVPYGDGRFDVIWSVAVVHHNPPDGQEHLLAEFARVLRPGGILVLLEGVGRSPRAESGIYFPRTRSGWAALAHRHGLFWRWSRGASYFLLRSMGERLQRRRGPTIGGGNSVWLRWAARVDSVLCPWLVGVLPPPFQRRAIMVFEKHLYQLARASKEPAHAALRGARTSARSYQGVGTYPNRGLSASARAARLPPAGLGRPGSADGRGARAWAFRRPMYVQQTAVGDA